MMGGQIGATSEVGKGSTFWCTARFEKCQTAPARLPPPIVSAHAGAPRILAVDDNETNRNILREQLTNWGFPVETAADGQAALDLLDRAVSTGRPFALAILDMNMPGMSGVDLARRIRASSSLEDTALIMLTSMDSGLSPAEMKECQIVNCLTKPVRQSRLLDALVEAVPGAAVAPPGPHPDEGRTPADTSQPAPAVRREGARILLAEDNEVNQEVAREILTSAGIHCDVAATGSEAVAAVLREPYDLILMDYHMPEMDGLEATRAIRDHEERGELPGRDGRRMPIIGLTASALAADRRRCLEAGMDECLRKPIEPIELLKTVDSRLPPVPRGQDGRPPPESPRQQEAETHRGSDNAPVPQEPAPFDLDELLHRCLGHQDHLQRLLSKFEDKAGELLEGIEESVAAGDAERIAFLAHTLKGMSATLSAPCVRAAAAEMEQLARSKDLLGADECLEVLRRQVQRCLDFLPKAATGTADTR